MPRNRRLGPHCRHACAPFAVVITRLTPSHRPRQGRLRGKDILSATARGPGSTPRLEHRHPHSEDCQHVPTAMGACPSWRIPTIWPGSWEQDHHGFRFDGGTTEDNKDRTVDAPCQLSWKCSQHGVCEACYRRISKVGGRSAQPWPTRCPTYHLRAMERPGALAGRAGALYFFTTASINSARSTPCAWHNWIRLSTL